MHKAVAGYEFPRVYRPVGFWKYGFPAFGLLSFVLALLMGWGFGQTKQLLFAIMGALFALGGLYMIAYARRTRLILRENEIELCGLVMTQTMRRDEIAGYRNVSTGNGPAFLLLLPRFENGRKLQVPGMFELDGAFQQWLNGLPNLDQRDAEQFNRQTEDNLELGTTPEERAATVKQARRVCRGLMIAALIVCGWTWVYPNPYRSLVLTLAALPWLAIYVTAHYHGVVVINEKKRDPHPGVGIPFIMPGLVLALRVIFDMMPLGWQKPLVLAMVISAVLCFAAWKVDVAIQQKPAILILLFLLSLGYGYGVSMEANAMFDRSEVTIYRTMVIGKYVSSGRSHSYNLRLAPWGPKMGGDTVQVSRRMYDHEQVGSTVCIGVRAGAAGIPWYFVRECR